MKTKFRLKEQDTKRATVDNAPLIEIKQLTKIFSLKGNDVVAVDNVTLSIEKGEYIAIVGESGAGKSTLFYMLAGLEKPSVGEIIIGGKDLSKMKKNDIIEMRRTEIGLIYQFFNLIPILTVEENITLPVKLANHKIDENKLEVLLRSLNLYDQRKRLPNELSGGQQQRAAIARAFFANPSIVLADEPTGNLDSKNSEEFMCLLERFNAQYNQTILIITHSDAIAQRAKRLIRMCDGKIVEDIVRA